jgi:hypothetical protein
VGWLASVENRSFGPRNPVPREMLSRLTDPESLPDKCLDPVQHRSGKSGVLLAGEAPHARARG